MCLMKSCEIDSRRRNQCRESGNKIQWLQYDVRCTIPIDGFELNPNIALAGERQPLFRDGRTCDVATQLFEFLPLVGLCANTGSEELAQLVHSIARRIGRRLERQGLLD